MTVFTSGRFPLGFSSLREGSFSTFRGIGFVKHVLDRVCELPGSDEEGEEVEDESEEEEDAKGDEEDEVDLECARDEAGERDGDPMRDGIGDEQLEEGVSSCPWTVENGSEPSSLKGLADRARSE
mmetsp:Transcript_25722/g.35678  ORF Transcript_25722/g.35678 Transcript_25722/m.35678 type:complete len:125 (-) Transcript_25722:718-1092(-)